MWTWPQPSSSYTGGCGREERRKNKTSDWLSSDLYSMTVFERSWLQNLDRVIFNAFLNWNKTNQF